MININDVVKYEHTWSHIINQYALDIICVACHYSTRYESSDEYLIKYSNDNAFNLSVFYLKDKQPVDFINTFIATYLDIHTNSLDITNANTNANTNVIIDNQSIRGTQITWKNMQYLWKHYLDASGLPSIMFLQTFKSILTDKLSVYYNEEHDTFIGICSKHLPVIQTFLNFWDETIIMDETETDFEIDEVVTLFRKWCETSCKINTTLNDKQILDLIAYFFPTIEIERDKYLSGIRCSLWDKQFDIQTSLDNMKNILRETHLSDDRCASPSINRNIAIYDAYIFYCKSHSCIQDKTYVQIVSKAYFEKFVFDNLTDYVIADKFISMDWYTI